MTSASLTAMQSSKLTLVGTSIAALRAAGAVIVGKTNVPELTLVDRI